MRNPTSFQARVLAVPEAHNIALLGGRGGGKSTSIVQLVGRHCAQYGELAKSLVIRQSYKALADIEESLLEFLHAMFSEFGPTQYNKSEKIGRLPNGATFELGFIEDQRSYLKHQGRECTLLAVDELTNFPTDKYVKLLRSNLRGPAGVPLRVVVAGNPGGPLHAKVAREHIDGRVPWRPYEHEDGTTWVTCPSVYTDNPHLDHARYAREIRAAAGNDLALAAAWLENDWGQISGAFFGSAFGPHCVLPDPEGWRPTAPGWVSFVSLDWGMSAPSVVLFCARPLLPGLPGPGGRVFSVGSLLVLDELATADASDPNLGLEWPPQMLAEEALARCRRWGVRPLGVGDDARGLEGSTLLEQLAKFGLRLKKPTKDRVSGWVATKQMMSAALRDDPDQPALFFSERCRYSLETIPALPRNPIRPEDVDTKAPDHAADALRYAVAYRPALRRVSSYLY